MRSNFIAQFTTHGGPAPELELDRIVDQTDYLVDGNESDAWFPTRKGAGWTPSIGAQCMLFCRTGSEGGISLIQATIIERSVDLPNAAYIQDFYRDHDFEFWWKVSDVKRRPDITSLANVPGTSLTQLPASETFRGNTTFAYWNFPLDSQVNSDGVTQPQHVDEPLAPPLLPARENQAAAGAYAQDLALHGVDFSGGAEPNGVNAKIWIATLQNGVVRLRNGRRDRFGRSQLPQMIHNEGGWWVLDFPFGVSQQTATAIGVNNWQEWLDWCGAEGTNAGYATLRRDAAREACAIANCQWSLRRRVDDEHRTTWFPLFEQLYRQTICGAAEVLAPLNTYGDVCILPWHQVNRTPDAKVAVEGFPGITIREHLGLPSTGYKGKSPDRQAARITIINALQNHGLPINETITEDAIRDPEGDALDALVLLLAAKTSFELGAEDWQTQRNALGENHTEGWFPS